MYTLIQTIGLIVCAIIVQTNGDYSYFMSPYSSDCKIESHGITTCAQLQEAIDAADDKSVILLDPITYTCDLKIENKNPQNYLTIDGDNQCNENTKIIGKTIISESKNLILRDIVVENTDKAIQIDKSHSIRLKNLVIKDINDDAIDVTDSDNIAMDNLVMDEIKDNAISLKSVNGIRVRNLVVSETDGIALLFENCHQIAIDNTVARDIDHEVIKITGDSSDSKIVNTVITSDSAKGEAWMYVEGNNNLIKGTVATGSPKNGIMMNGCNNQFSNNILTMDSGVGFYFLNKDSNCRNRLGLSNMVLGARYSYNQH